uniref:TSA: Wollemia nobilis Ref_Wollemi_Transcript_18795_1838 transcribed RNA sequence n=1 Tax=Wollemia nobilis TaxID=56998 RepID=A0A0C9RI69_9CONI
MARPNPNSIRYILRLVRTSPRNSAGPRILEADKETSVQASSCVPKSGIYTFAGYLKGFVLQPPLSVYEGENKCRRVFRTVLQTRKFHATGTMSIGARDFYDILGVKKGASQAEIKKAYYALAKQHHPDVNKGDPDTEKKFQEIQRAYEVLKDDEKRSLYDRIGPEGFAQAEAGGSPGGPGGAGFGGFGFGGFGFEDMFRGGMDETLKNMFNQGSFGGEDVKVTLELSFMEAVQGCTKNLSYQTFVSCSSCNGSGVPAGTIPQTCRDCKGSGTLRMQRGAFRMESICSTCGGSGKIVKEFCKTCRGDRVVRGQKKITLDVMAGIDNAETLRVLGRGGADPEGGHPGDLFVNIKVREDPVFRREGADIHVDENINFTQAILGGTIQVPTLTGEVALKVRPGTQHGQKVVLKGKGIKLRHSSQFGNQYVHFRVIIPTHITKRQKSLIEEFAKEESNDDEKRAAEASG